MTPRTLRRSAYRRLRDALSRGLAGGLRTPDDPHARAVRHVVIRDLFGQVGPLIVTGLLTVAIVTAIFWTVIDRTTLLLWAALAMVTLAARLALATRFNQRRPGPERLDFWTAAFVAGAGVSGLMWGVTGWLFFVPGSVLLQVAIVFLLAGMATAAIAAYAAHRPTFYVFLIPTLVPYGARLIVEGGEVYLLLAALLLFWMTVVASMGGRLNRSVVERVSLQLLNAQLVERLSRARDEAEQASQAKTRFLANTSHELKTPLNAIIGFSEVMKNRVFGPLGSPKYERYAADIHDSGNHLLKVIDDILDVSKIESGATGVEEREIDVESIAAGILTIMRERAEPAGVALRLEAAADLPKLCADETKLRQILINLLSNGVKFTGAGGTVTLALGLDRRGDYALTVTDTGRGMDPADIPRALLPFVQVHAAGDDGEREGTGLGLPLVKSLLELHGGSLSIESAPGKGTTVRARFPSHRIVGRRNQRRSDALPPAAE